MKKLILTAATVCAAIVTQAATANWKVSAANIFDGSGSTTKYAGNAYFFDADAISQSALFALFDADNGLDLSSLTGYLASGTAANGVISSASNQFGAFEQGIGDHNFFFVLVDGDKMFLSDAKMAAAPGTDNAQQITFGAQTAGSKLTTVGYTGVGQWAQSQAVPEPMSAVLVLLGVAGLALKRKRV